MTRDEGKWKNWVDNNQPSGDDPGYGFAVIKYAEEWANNMEAAMVGGKSVAEVASSCEPKGHGITGFMYGAACAVLADCWAHGEALRVWHNGNYGVGTEKTGTVNPAILTVKDSAS